jgi:hypothetical protein
MLITRFILRPLSLSLSLSLSLLAPLSFQTTLSPSNAFVLLNGFCQWQNSINGRNGPHHDVAVMVTRKDICEGSGNNCGTLGMKNAIILWFRNEIAEHSYFTFYNNHLFCA